MPTRWASWRRPSAKPIAEWEPRADVENVTVEPHPKESGRVTISVTYRLRTTNDQRNLVYPFYVIPGRRSDEVH